MQAKPFLIERLAETSILLRRQKRIPLRAQPHGIESDFPEEYKPEVITQERSIKILDRACFMLVERTMIY
ncbi:MAG: hypothetical protein WCR91_08925 [Sphaerochaetaceae bacterium]